MPQMMPYSWSMVFLSSILVFMIINSCWSTFFFLPSFPVEKTSYYSMKKNFFN